MFFSSSSCTKGTFYCENAAKGFVFRVYLSLLDSDKYARPPSYYPPEKAPVTPLRQNERHNRPVQTITLIWSGRDSRIRTAIAETVVTGGGRTRIFKVEPEILKNI